MGHFIEWDNEEKTVLLQKYTEGAAKDDLYHLAKKSAAMLKSVSHTVHLIIDESTIKLTLNSADILFLEKHVPPNQGKVVMIVDTKSLGYKKIVQQMSNKLAPKAFDQPYFAESLDEARHILQEQFEVTYP